MARRAAGVMLAVAVALNVLAYFHARSFTRFAEAGARTPAPEHLSWPARLRILLTGATLPRPENDRTPADVGLPYEVRRFKAADGTELEAWWVPADAPRGTVVLFHGYADRKASMLGLAAALHPLGYAALLVDFRGSGGSAGNATSIGWYEAEDVVAALRHAVAAGLPRPHVAYGVSMGAVAVLRAVGDRGGEADALIVQYPFDRLLTTTRNRFRAMGVPASPGAEILVFWGGVVQGYNGFAFAPVDSAARVRQPTLVLCGGRDQRVRPADCRRVADALAGDKQLVLFEGAGHVSLLENDPERWRQAVTAFLAGVSRPPSPAGID